MTFCTANKFSSQHGQSHSSTEMQQLISLFICYFSTLKRAKICLAAWTGCFNTGLPKSVSIWCCLTYVAADTRVVSSQISKERCIQKVKSWHHTKGVSHRFAQLVMIVLMPVTRLKSHPVQRYLCGHVASMTKPQRYTEYFHKSGKSISI